MCRCVKLHATKQEKIYKMKDKKKENKDTGKWRDNKPWWILFKKVSGKTGTKINERKIRREEKRQSKSSPSLFPQKKRKKQYNNNKS